MSKQEIKERSKESKSCRNQRDLQTRTPLRVRER
jgi:hypothetical protein